MGFADYWGRLPLGRYCNPFYRVFFYGVGLSRADPEDLFPLINGMLRINSIEAFLILIASLLTLIGISIYYRWTSK